MNIFLIVMGIIVSLLLIGAILHGTYYKGKLRKIKPCGRLIDVYDGKMHIHSMGNGEKTIVLLPGMGVALPTSEFSPLMKRLSEKYTVVCIEYFGTGFSTGTSRERSCKNYVEEIRTVLSSAGFNGKYILMPHSVSNIYSEYYAAKYPNEIEGIIALDGTSTAYYEKVPNFLKYILLIGKFQQFIGLTSVLGNVIINKKLLMANGYEEKEIDNSITFSGFLINDTLLEQMLNSMEFVNQTMQLNFPKTVPYLKIIAKDTYNTNNKKLKMTGKDYQDQHLERIGEHAEYEILEGTHFIYQTNLDKILNITDEFLEKCIEKSNIVV